MQLSVIVPATDSPPTLDRCLSAIRAADEPPEEILVVESAHGPGPAAARNEGARRATGEVIVFVDADVSPRRDAFARIRAAFAADPALAGLFGSYDDEPAAPGVVSRFRNLLHHHVHQTAAGDSATFWAGLGALRAGALRSVGGFDAARYPAASVEDIELGMRLFAAGKRIVLDPAVQGTHLKAWTVSEMVRTDFARRGVPWAELRLERGRSPTTLNLGPRHRASALAVVAIATGVAARRPRVVGTGVAVLLVLNAPFYRLLVRREGVARAAAGVALHTLHHLTAVAAALTAVAAAATRRARRDEPAQPMSS
jgi:Glycosyl transferase family group 2